MDNKVYALNLFNIKSKSDYAEYAKRSLKEVNSRGGRVVSLGRFKESVKGDIASRQVMILVEWESKDAFNSYVSDETLTDLHRLRELGTQDYLWHLFDQIADLRPILGSLESD